VFFISGAAFLMIFGGFGSESPISQYCFAISQGWEMTAQPCGSLPWFGKWFRNLGKSFPKVGKWLRKIGKPLRKIGI
jgi:hypothetical protein